MKIGMVGKYVHLARRYKSLHEALVHGGLANDVQGRARVHRLARDREGRAPRSSSRTSTPSSCRAASATAGPRGRSTPSATRARTRSRSSASASACSSRWSSSRATSPGSRAPTRTEFDATTPYPVIDLHGRAEGGRPRRAARCAWAPTPAQLAGARSPAGSTAGADQRAPPPPLRVQQRLPRAIRRARAWWSRASQALDLVEMVELPSHPHFIGVPVPPRVQEQALRAAPAVRRICESGGRLPRSTEVGRRSQKVALFPWGAGVSPATDRGLFTRTVRKAASPD